MLGAFLVALVACQPGDGLDTAYSGPGTPSPVFAYSITPPALALGEIEIGQAATGQLTLTNTGELELQVPELGDLQAEGIDSTLGGAAQVPPGDSVPIEVIWTPTGAGSLAADLTISLGPSAAELELATVPITGTALGPVATLSTDAHDFGEVGLGCDEDFTFTLTNTGNLDLEVTAVSARGAETFRITEPLDLPWTLAGMQSRGQVVHFAPADLEEALGELVFETNLGQVVAALTGRGVVDEERTLTFEVEEQRGSTVIWNVNGTAIPGSSLDMFGDRLEASLEVFFETLLENDVAFRTAFIVEVEGTVTGEHAYIDDSFTAPEATEAALGMLANHPLGLDNDATFRTLLNAVDVNQSWLSEDEGWAESSSNLVAIQRDLEQSGNAWPYWAGEIQSYKDDPDDVVFHAIAGPIPSGCSGADPFTDYDGAIDATGGILLSICDSDWTTHMSQLAAACIEGSRAVFSLTGTPMETSIEVSIDGEASSEGWAYDASLNAVVFEAGSYPPVGSELAIQYWLAGDCGQ
jgi:hypothetical protein